MLIFACIPVQLPPDLMALPKNPQTTSDVSGRTRSRLADAVWEADADAARFEASNSPL